MMRLPIVSRERYDEVTKALREDLAAARKRNDALLDTIIAMKLSGAQVVRTMLADPATGQPVKLQPPLRSNIQRAIDDNKHARVNPALRRYLARWAADQLAMEDADEEKIEERLRSWSIVAEDDDDDDEDDDEGLVNVGQTDRPGREG